MPGWGPRAGVKQSDEDKQCLFNEKKIQWGFTFHLDLKLLKMELHA